MPFVHWNECAELHKVQGWSLWLDFWQIGFNTLDSRGDVVQFVRQTRSQEMTEVCAQSPGCSLLPDHYVADHRWGDSLEPWRNSRKVILVISFLLHSKMGVQSAAATNVVPLCHILSQKGWCKVGKLKWVLKRFDWSINRKLLSGHVSSQRRTKITLWCVFQAKMDGSAQAEARVFWVLVGSS